MASRAPILQEKDLNYPKAMYKPASPGLGDLKSPAYEKIVIVDGAAQRKPEYYPYNTMIAEDAREEKKLVQDGWVDHPSKMEVKA